LTEIIRSRKAASNNMRGKGDDEELMSLSEMQKDYYHCCYSRYYKQHRLGRQYHTRHYLFLQAVLRILLALTSFIHAEVRKFGAGQIFIVSKSILEIRRQYFLVET
jgi:hypothetical protein